MLPIARRQPTFQVAAVSHGRSCHVVPSIVSTVGLRIVACLMAILGLLGGGAFAGTGDSLRKIVIFQTGTSAQLQRQVVTQSGSQVLNVLPLINGVAIKLPTQGTEQAMAVLQAHPTVTGVYDDPAVAGQDGGGDNVIVITPADPLTYEFYPWGLDAIHVPDVHQKEPGLKGAGVTVAILDTGIDINHPDLKKNIKGGYNALAGEDPWNYQDDNGHGTHMAGIIAARMNRLGVIGAAYQVQIVAVKVLDQNGNGLLSDLINGLGWIYTNEIKVVNMSLGFSENSLLLEQAIKRLHQAGVIMVASAGNQGITCAQDGGGDDGGGDDGGGDSGCQPAQGGVNYPARYPEVISVAATNGDGQVTGYSQSGKVDVAAPGGSKSGLRIFSTHKGGGYGLGSGTSQAAAHVTGAITLAFQKKPQMSFDEVVTLLQWTSRVLCEPSEPELCEPVSEERQGAGLINVEAMINALK
jgi:subtilisin family serine protease